MKKQTFVDGMTARGYETATTLTGNVTATKGRPSYDGCAQTMKKYTSKRPASKC